MAVKYYPIPSADCTAPSVLTAQYGFLCIVADTEGEKPTGMPYGTLCFVKTSENVYRSCAAGWEESGTNTPLDTLSVPTDVTTLNATTSAHGLLPKLSGNASQVLKGDGTWGAGGAGGSTAELHIDFFAVTTPLVL